MHVLKHRKLENGSYFLAVHTDENKTTEEGEPDPQFIREFEWPSRPKGMKVEDYEEMMLREAKLLIEHEFQSQEKPKEKKEVKPKAEKAPKKKAPVEEDTLLEIPEEATENE